MFIPFNSRVSIFIYCVKFNDKLQFICIRVGFKVNGGSPTYIEHKNDWWTFNTDVKYDVIVGGTTENAKSLLQGGILTLLIEEK